MMKEYLAQAGIREAGAMDDVAQAARDAATVLEVILCVYVCVCFFFFQVCPICHHRGRRDGRRGAGGERCSHRLRGIVLV